MRRTRRAAVIIGVVMLAITGSALWAVQSGAVTPQAKTKFPAGPQGENFTVHTDADQGFCAEDVPSSEATALSVQQCAARDTQRWTLAQSSDNSSVIIDDSGQCMEFGGAAMASAKLTPCTFKTPEHFLYSATGQIETTNGKFCLQADQSAAGASIKMPKCVVGLVTQEWVLGR
jgi:hypothetical protein